MDKIPAWLTVSAEVELLETLMRESKERAQKKRKPDSHSPPARHSTTAGIYCSTRMVQLHSSEWQPWRKVEIAGEAQLLSHTEGKTPIQRKHAALHDSKDGKGEAWSLLKEIEAARSQVP